MIRFKAAKISTARPELVKVADFANFRGVRVLALPNVPNWVVRVLAYSNLPNWWGARFSFVQMS